jgi:hypothetical protein
VMVARRTLDAADMEETAETGTDPASGASAVRGETPATPPAEPGAMVETGGTVAETRRPFRQSHPVVLAVVAGLVDRQLSQQMAAATQSAEPPGLTALPIRDRPQLTAILGPQSKEQLVLQVRMAERARQVAILALRVKGRADSQEGPSFAWRFRHSQPHRRSRTGVAKRHSRAD